MIINKTEHEVNNLETIDGKLVDTGKKTTVEINLIGYYEKETYINDLVKDLESTVDKLKLLKLEQELDKRLEKKHERKN